MDARFAFTGLGNSFALNRSLLFSPFTVRIRLGRLRALMFYGMRRYPIFGADLWMRKSTLNTCSHDDQHTPCLTPGCSSRDRPDHRRPYDFPEQHTSVLHRFTPYARAHQCHLEPSTSSTSRIFDRSRPPIRWVAGFLRAQSSLTQKSISAPTATRSDVLATRDNLFRLYWVYSTSRNHRSSMALSLERRERRGLPAKQQEHFYHQPFLYFRPYFGAPTPHSEHRLSGRACTFQRMRPARCFFLHPG